MNDYFRQFIMLSSENKEINSKGRIIIDAKSNIGKAQIIAQGLIPDEQFQLVFLIKDELNIIGLDIGSFWADYKGKIDTKFEFLPYNINNSNYKAKDVEGALILKANSKNIEPLLSGFVGNIFSWRSNFTIFKEDSNINKTKAQNIEIEPNKEEANKELEYDNKKDEESKKIIDKEIDKEKELKDIDSLFETESIIEIFDIKNSIWIATSPNSIKNCKKIYELADDEVIKQAFQSHKHIILGKINDEENKKYIIGAPDIYKSLSSFSIQSKFGNFKCIHSIKEGLYDGAHGYWLKEIE